MDKIKSKQCIGWGKWKNNCSNTIELLSELNPNWCKRCDAARIVQISNQFKDLENSFSRRLKNG